MSYKIYKNVKVLKIRVEEVTPSNRTADISGNKYGRDNFSVQVAELSNHEPAVTFSDFKNLVISGHTLSVAVNDRLEVISVINHTSGKQGQLQKGNIFKDLLEGIIPLLVIAAIFSGVAYKAFQTTTYYNAGYGIIAIGIIILCLFVRGINKQYRESAHSFKELKK